MRSSPVVFHTQTLEERRRDFGEKKKMCRLRTMNFYTTSIILQSHGRDALSDVYWSEMVLYSWDYNYYVCVLSSTKIFREG